MDIEPARDRVGFWRSFLFTKRFSRKKSGEEKYHGFQKHPDSHLDRGGMVGTLWGDFTHAGNQHLTQEELSCSGGTAKDRR